MLETNSQLISVFCIKYQVYAKIMLMRNNAEKGSDYKRLGEPTFTKSIL